jgi:hypothetical protein
MVNPRCFEIDAHGGRPPLERFQAAWDEADITHVDEQGRNQEEGLDA